MLTAWSRLFPCTIYSAPTIYRSQPYRAIHRSSKAILLQRTTLKHFKTMTTNVPASTKRFKDDHPSTGSSEGVKIGTHDGIFHCDEVLACFMLQQLPRYASAQIIRTRDMAKLDECDIVVDVGAKFDREHHRYDHHQGEFNETLKSLRPEMSVKWDIRLSSAGLVYTYFGEEVIKQILKDKLDMEPTVECLRAIYAKVYDGLISEIDAIDNGVPMFEGGEPRYNISTHLSARVGAFNSRWDEPTPAPGCLERFEKAKAYVGLEFVDKVTYYACSWWPARDIVSKALANRLALHESGEILELEKPCPWKEHLYQLEQEQKLVGTPKYVIYCNKEHDWRVICVPVQPSSFVCRKFLAKAWCGVRDENLVRVSGIAGSNFCHQTGFIGGNKTREGALKMAIASLTAPNEA
ncbi:MYG1 exonuclease [Anopheles maculipalpis]|uniref:MYG1 exonuclease n=1 Tax=Anopheles maculipalpis TaxID=1496333 RepID=UPI002159367A|nr:MYG1 exonuclease [Anopheles maculipalpis]